MLLLCTAHVSLHELLLNCAFLLTPVSLSFFASSELFWKNIFFIFRYIPFSFISLFFTNSFLSSLYSTVSLSKLARRTQWVSRAIFHFLTKQAKSSKRAALVMDECCAIISELQQLAVVDAMQLACKLLFVFAEVTLVVATSRTMDNTPQRSIFDWRCFNSHLISTLNEYLHL